MLRSPPNFNRTSVCILTTFNKNFKSIAVLVVLFYSFEPAGRNDFCNFYGLFITLPSSHRYHICSASFLRSKLPSVNTSGPWHLSWFCSVAFPSHILTGRKFAILAISNSIFNPFACSDRLPIFKARSPPSKLPSMRFPSPWRFWRSSSVASELGSTLRAHRPE